MMAACLSGTDDPPANACVDLAKRYLADADRLVSIGERLRSAGRYGATVDVLSIAAHHYPKDRRVLQALIRARAARRAAWVIEGAPTTPAFQPVPRAKDVRRSSEIDGSVLAQQSAEEAERGPNSAEEMSLAARLELLDSLRERELVTLAEYRARRASLLDAALLLPTTSRVEVPIGESFDPNQFGRYRALVIGNSRYRNLPDLRTPVADAQAVAKLLSSDYGFDVQTLTNVDRDTLAHALSDLRKSVRSDDNVLIYYAGHGYLDDVTKRGYWLPVDAAENNTANWVSTADVIDTLSGIPARHGLVIADSCFSGALLRAAGRRPGATTPELLQRLLEKRSRTVLTSGGLEPVVDGGRGIGRTRHSVFAAAFLAALRANPDVLEAERLFLELRDRVTLNADQTPQYAPIRNAGHEGGDFIFLRRS